MKEVWIRRDLSEEVKNKLRAKSRGKVNKRDENTGTSDENNLEIYRQANEERVAQGSPNGSLRIMYKM